MFILGFSIASMPVASAGDVISNSYGISQRSKIPAETLQARTIYPEN
jgi:hypothetical protein